jgi:hypothetical protein
MPEPVSEPVTWGFTMTPWLLSGLLSTSRLAGELSCAPLSFYRRQEFSAKVRRERILWVSTGAAANVKMHEVDVVLRGQRLDERRERVADAIRRAAIAEEALRVYTSHPHGKSLTAELAMAYQSAEKVCPGRDLRRWFSFTARERERLLDLHLERVTVPPEVRRLFDWVAAEPMVRESTVLRAAMYFWGMAKHFGQWNSVSTVLMHEFCVGRVDPYGLLSLSCATEAQRNLQGSAFDGQAMDSTGDFTTMFEKFVSALDLVLRERVEQLGRITDNAAYLPWQVVAPPDELEARMFDVVQRLGTAGSTAIVAALGSDVPPMRTVQRRLQKMVRERTIVKNGARKMATYSVPGRDVA